jgi:hypothetical protein
MICSMPRRYLPKGLQTANMPLVPDRAATLARGEAQQPFIPISRQAGVEAAGLPDRLAKELSGRQPGKTWKAWDENLLEKVSADSHIPVQLIDSVEKTGYSWLDDLLVGLSGEIDELAIIHRLKQVVRSIARGGQAILVGHGSAFITHDVPDGLHVRLIAPLDLRIKNVTQRLKLSDRDAERHLRRVDRQRQLFFRRLWPDHQLTPDMFAAVLNVAKLNEERMTRSILAML